jgi:hypothetical protein
VLVLGAGASAPYGFPTARELKQLIWGAFVKDSVATRTLHEGSEIPMNLFIEFRDAFHRSGQSSVDAFLEHRPEFIEVGKLAIAWCLIPYESEDALFENVGNRGGDWYQYLAEKLSTSFDEFGKNRLSVVTFNYDRSLEHYLFTTLRNAHGRNDVKCARMLPKIPIHHVYGQISRHPYVEREARPYTPDRTTYKRVGYAARGITLAHDKTPPAMEAAIEALNDAETICFLGFSYHPLNMERLRLQDSAGRSVFGTARGLIGNEVGATAAALRSILLTPRVELSDADNLAVLRQHLVFG